MKLGGDAPGLVQHVVFCTRGAYRSDEDDEALGRSPHGRILTGAAADVVQDVLLRRRGEGHWLHAWCVMPNHVHVLVEVRGAPSPGLVAAWKSVSSREVNALLDRMGALWQPNYFDRFMRDEEQFGATKTISSVIPSSRVWAPMRGIGDGRRRGARKLERGRPRPCGWQGLTGPGAAPRRSLGRRFWCSLSP